MFKLLSVATSILVTSAYATSAEPTRQGESPDDSPRVQELESQVEALKRSLQAHRYLETFSNRKVGNFVPLVTWVQITSDGELSAGKSLPADPEISLPPGWNQLTIEGRSYVLFPVDKTLPFYDEATGYDWDWQRRLRSGSLTTGKETSIVDGRDEQLGAPVKKTEQ